MPVSSKDGDTHHHHHKKKKKKNKHKSKKDKRRSVEEDIEQPAADLEGHKQKKEKRKRKAEKQEVQDNAAKMKKKIRKLSLIQEGDGDSCMGKEKKLKKKRKGSLEFEKTIEQEDNYERKKKKQNKSVRKEERTQNDENNYGTIKKRSNCNEETLRKKSKNKKKGEKIKSKESTENQKLLEVAFDKESKQKSEKRKDKNKARPEEDSSYAEDVNPIHFDWMPSEELKQKFKIRQGRWTKKEEEILKKNMEHYLLENELDDPSKLIFAHLHNESEEGRKWKEFARTTNFYRKLGRGLNRGIFFIYRKVLRSFDQDNYLGKFSESEDRELEKLITIHGRKWEKIGRMMGRSGLAVLHRYHWNNGSRGKWKDNEVDLLREAVRKITYTEEDEEVFTNINWNAVASIVKTRNPDQCRKKWLLQVCWKDCTLEPWKRWGAEEDLKLIKRVYECSATEEYDIDWCELQKDFQMARSPVWLHMKFKVILKKYCNFIDLENAEFEDVIDYLYNVKRKELENRYCDHQDSSQE